MTTSASVSRAEYLKRYLDPPKKKKHNKKKKDGRIETIVDGGRSVSSSKRYENESGNDLSPPRKMLTNSNNGGRHTPSVKLCGNESDSDLSPPRRTPDNNGGRHPSAAKRPRNESGSDLSPPRAFQHQRQRGHRSVGDRYRSRSPSKRIDSEGRRRRDDDAIMDNDSSRVAVKREERVALPKVMIKQEIEERQEAFDDGRYAEPKKRVTLFNKSRRRGGGSDEDPERKSRETTKQKELEEKYKNWTKGITQTKQREERLKDMEETLNEGFARYADDEAMNKYLKEQLNEELDPMAEYYKAKKQKIEMKTGLVYPTYKGHYPPNRFGIAPGYRWDGVDRSNGFEGKLAQEENKRRSMQTEAYRSIIECED